MKQNEFIKILDNRLKVVKDTFLKKNEQYGIGDAFHNFKVAGQMDGITPIQALRGMDLKHRVSIKDMVDNPSMVTTEMIDEKITDYICYAILLEGLFIEHIDSCGYLRCEAKIHGPDEVK